MASGIWTRLGAMVPGSRETWRHYTGEIAVVVIGVLIALGADQAARYVNDRAETAEARERIRLELINTAGLGFERLAIEGCIKDRIKLLSEGLVAGRRNWDDAVYPDAPRRAPRFFKEIYRTPGRPWVVDAYQEALAQGDLDAASRKERELLAAEYTQIKTMAELNREEFRLATELSVLQTNLELSPTRRAELLAVLTRLDAINAGMVLIAGQLIKRQRELGPEYRIRYEENATGARIKVEWAATLRTVYGTCAKPEVIESFGS